MENHRHRHRENFKFLFEAVMAISDAEICEKFLFDLFTMQELEMLVQRLQVAKCFYEGEPTYKQVGEVVKVSSATICRVRQAYNHGNGGFKMVFDNMKNNMRT